MFRLPIKDDCVLRPKAQNPAPQTKLIFYLNAMKKFKLTLGLILCLGFLGSTSMIKQQTSAEIGIALAKAFKAGETGTKVIETGCSALGAYGGAKLGASIGVIGGPAGVLIGGLAGLL